MLIKQVGICGGNDQELLKEKTNVLKERGGHLLDTPKITPIGSSESDTN